ncbi:MAG TPA: hypothetical protein VK989_01910 [Polyangia bacterium]|jgi:hypothetical protein|nr:hypothetical protein [Polyangia bacterium]
MKERGAARCVVLASIGLALAGCGGRALPERIAVAQPDDVDVTGLHFTTSSAFPENPPPTNVDVTLTDPVPTRAIYEATLALPAFPSGRFNCPNDPGYRHTIAFTNGASVVVTAVLNPDGCRDVTIAGAPPARETDDDYWALLAQNLGVEETAFFSLATP